MGTACKPHVVEDCLEVFAACVFDIVPLIGVLVCLVDPPFIVAGKLVVIRLVLNPFDLPCLVEPVVVCQLF